MAEYIYCISNPAVPDVIRLDKSGVDPRQALSELGSRAGSQKINWVLRVRDSDASLMAVTNALAAYAHPDRNNHFHCEPMRARSVAIQHTNDKMTERTEQVDASSLPSLVLGLGLGLQLLCIPGATVALVASSLFWVVHTLPMGSRQQAQVPA